MRGPPGPRGHWLTGNLAAYEQDRVGFLLDLHDQYRPMARFGPRTVVVTDPGLAAEILRDRAGAFGVSENFLQQRVTAAEMARRLSPRPLLNAALRPAALGQAAALLAANLDAALDATASRAEWFDPVPLLERVYSRTIAELCFGRDTGVDAEELSGRVGALLDELAQIIGNPFALPGWIRSPTRRRIEDRYAGVRELVVPALRQRSREPGRYLDLAGAVTAANHDTHPVTRIADMLIGALLAGQRVPAAAGSWLLMLLADHPHVQAALHDQRSLHAATPSVPCRHARLPPDKGTAVSGDPPLLRRVVLESLRLYPATWILARRAERTVDVAGWQFAAGHNFLISPYALHRDPDLFADPLAFRPDRWRRATAHPSASLAFGAGIHLCPGRNLTTEVLAATITTLADRYVIQRAPGTVALEPRTTLLPVGLALRLIPRTANRPPAVADAADVSAAGVGQAPARFFAATSA